MVHNPSAEGRRRRVVRSARPLLHSVDRQAGQRTVSSSERPSPIDQPTFWRETGGERWVANIETVERQIAELGRILLDRAAPRPGERVLDIGCGGGVTSAELARLVGPSGHVVGLDVADVILDVARRRYANVANLRFEAGDAELVPLPARTFDLITSRFGVMFFEDPVAAFANLATALKTGGRLVFMCWRTPPENPWMTAPAAAVFGVLGPPPPPDPDAPGPFAFGDPDRVRRILSAGGFTGIELEPVDETVDLGSVERAVELMSELGPAAALLAEAGEADRAKAIDAVTEALRPFATADGLRLPSATWIVSAGLPE